MEISDVSSSIVLQTYNITLKAAIPAKAYAAV
jgi:hypothetical protein